MTEHGPKSPEQLQTVPVAWVFDVDGVVTDPIEKCVIDEGMYDEFIIRLERGEPVTFNTGRSLDFIEHQVTTPLLERIKAQGKDVSIMHRVYAVGEKGGIELIFNQNGSFQEVPDPRFSVPETIQNQVRDLVNQSFSETTFYDETKRTMVSTEMKDGLDVENVFRPHQQRLLPELQHILAEHDPDKQFKIDPTTIATDIEDKRVGKALGARKTLDWLDKMDLKPELFVTFGDSSSDLPMAEELQKTHPTILVFVGEDLAENNIERVKRPQAIYTAGTLEYLRNPDFS